MCYEYKVLHYNLTPSPNVFKVLAHVMGHLRLQGLGICPFLNDILFNAESKEGLSIQVSVTVKTLTQTGFIINTESL